jgi:hypothetical protein
MKNSLESLELIDVSSINKVSDKAIPDSLKNSTVHCTTGGISSPVFDFIL